MQNQTTETQGNQTKSSESNDKNPIEEERKEDAKTLDEQRVHHAAEIDKIAEAHLKKLSRVRLGHEAMMVQDAAKTLSFDRESREHGLQDILSGGSVDNSQVGAETPNPSTGGLQDGTLGSLLGGMEDMINLGDIHVSNTQSPKTTQPEKSSLGKLAKAGLAAALIGSGAGAGYGIPLMLSALKPDKKPVISIPKNTDTYNEIRLHPPKSE